MTRYLLNRGTRRVAHLATYDAWGRILGAWCGRDSYNMTSNVPFGRPCCKDCLRKMNA